MFPNMNKMFDPAQANVVLQNMQKMFDPAANAQQAETCQKIASIWQETLNSCYEQNMKMAQAAMSDSMACMQDISSAQGIEDMVAKQTEWGQKYAKTCQTSAESISQTMQKGYQKATDAMVKSASSKK